MFEMLVLSTFALVWLCLFLGTDRILAQEVNSASLTYVRKSTEQKLGIDDLLVNGIRYYPENTQVEGSPDFEIVNTVKSVLFIKGQEFSGIRMSYDIVSDQALLIQEFGNGLENRIVLHPALVDSFTLGSHLFINPSNWFEKSSLKGYFEKISDGDIQYLKKHRKSYLKIYDNLNKGKYSPQQFSGYLIDKKGKLTQVKNRKSFLKYFTAKRKTISQYMKVNNISLKKSTNPDIRNLMNFCNSLPE